MEPIILKHKNKDGTVTENEYFMVKDRIRAFRKDHPLWSLTTYLEKMEAGNVVFKATIADESGRVLATGYAWEQVNASYINKTSAVENCETSAIGRALAAMGYVGDESYASHEEMQKTIDSETMDYLFELLRNSTFDDEQKFLMEASIRECTLSQVDEMIDNLSMNQLDEADRPNPPQKAIQKKLNKIMDNDNK